MYVLRLPYDSVIVGENVRNGDTNETREKQQKTIFKSASATEAGERRSRREKAVAPHR